MFRAPKRSLALLVCTLTLAACGEDVVDSNNDGTDMGVADLAGMDVGGDAASPDMGGATVDMSTDDAGSSEDAGAGLDGGDAGGAEDMGVDVGTEDAGMDGCQPDQYLDGVDCVACAPGTTSAGGVATACDPIRCAANERVSSNVCVPCDAQEVNAAGDDASGPDTACDAGDPCTAALGVSCATFDEAYLKASNTGAGDLFGFSVAIDGDTLAVGAYREGSNATGIDGDQTSNQSTDSGAVYVFTRSGSTWTQQAYLKASNTGLSDFFGYAVALHGDTLAVGAYGENSSAAGINGDQSDEMAPESGAVYVFTRSGTSWGQEAYLKASNPGADDSFGGAVALHGDTLAVGAFKEDSNATGVNGNDGDNSAQDSGAAYVFTRSGTTWSQEAYLKGGNTEAGDNFGISVALDGDSLVVGAYQEDSNATGVGGDGMNNASDGSGAAYVFTRNGTTWSQQAYLKASNTGDGDIFGYTVAIEADTLVVGAHLEDSDATGLNGDGTNDNTTRSGAAYVFTRTGVVWSEEAYVKASNPEGGDNFGFAVALSGDFLAIAAASEDGGAVGLNGDETSNGRQNSGAVFLFSRATGTWTQVAYIKSSNPDPADAFGRALALDGDTMVVGALEEDGGSVGVNGDQTTNNLSRSGAAYVRRIAP